MLVILLVISRRGKAVTGPAPMQALSTKVRANHDGRAVRGDGRRWLIDAEGAEGVHEGGAS